MLRLPLDCGLPCMLCSLLVVLLSWCICGVLGCWGCVTLPAVLNGCCWLLAAKGDAAVAAATKCPLTRSSLSTTEPMRVDLLGGLPAAQAVPLELMLAARELMLPGLPRPGWIMDPGVVGLMTPGEPLDCEEVR